MYKLTRSNIIKFFIIIIIWLYCLLWFIAPTDFWNPETYISDRIEDQEYVKSCSKNYLIHWQGLSREVVGLVPVTHRVVVDADDTAFTFNQKFFFVTIGKWEYECKQGGFRREIW